MCPQRQPGLAQRLAGGDSFAPTRFTAIQLLGKQPKISDDSRLTPAHPPNPSPYTERERRPIEPALPGTAIAASGYWLRDHVLFHVMGTATAATANAATASIILTPQTYGRRGDDKATNPCARERWLAC